MIDFLIKALARVLMHILPDPGYALTPSDDIDDMLTALDLTPDETQVVTYGDHDVLR